MDIIFLLISRIRFCIICQKETYIRPNLLYFLNDESILVILKHPKVKKKNATISGKKVVTCVIMPACPFLNTNERKF